MSSLRKTVYALLCASAVLWGLTACDRDKDDTFVAAPTCTHQQGVIAIGDYIRFECITPYAQIYYTTDGTTPDRNSTWCSNVQNIQVTQNTTFKVIAISPEGYCSEVVTFLFIACRKTVSPVTTIVSYDADNVTISMTCSDLNSEIYYTTDGTNPDKTSTRYTDQITIPLSATLKAIAYSPEYAPGDIITRNYRASQTIAASELNELLKSLPVNSPENPYRLTLTGLTHVTETESEEGFALRKVLSDNWQKYVSLSFEGQDISFDQDAFYWANTLVEIAFPEGITELPYGIVRCSKNLKKVVLPDSVKKIGDSAFDTCHNLKELKLSSGLEEIGAYALKECSSLTQIQLPEGLKEIKQGAFKDCSSITQLQIPSSVETIWPGITENCTSLTSITVAEENTTYDSRDNCNAIIQKFPSYFIAGCSTTVIPSTVSKILSYAFSGCTGLTQITIPSTVSEISSDAFRGCTGLTEITIPSTVTKMGQDVFNGCKNLQKVTIEGINELCNRTFQGCTSLTTMILPATLEKIDSAPFQNASSLTTICFRGTQEQWNAITKSDSWDEGSSVTTITCNYTE